VDVDLSGFEQTGEKVFEKEVLSDKAGTVVRLLAS
jgi:hypothetical protein